MTSVTADATSNAATSLNVTLQDGVAVLTFATKQLADACLAQNDLVVFSNGTRALLKSSYWLYC